MRQALLDVRRQTLALAEGWLAAGAEVPGDPWLNPPRWEWGHIAWFQEYWLARNRQRDHGQACEPGHARAPSLLAHADAWYDSSRVAHDTRWSLALPDARATLRFLADTQEQTLALLDALPPEPGHEALYFFRLVALHEAMHAEASIYMAHRLGVKLPVAAPASVPGSPGGIDVPAGRFRLGSAGPGFAFDNELEAHDTVLDAFEIDSEPVSWQRFQSFVDDGGYAQRRWWSGQGWAWREQARPAPPTIPAGGAQAPAVHLSAFEAQAWCRWAGRRLPTEAQWECAALTQPAFRWGQVWEWTDSAFLPYPGFTAHPYREYSAPWFGSRQALRGAAHATSRWLAHPRYRNFFEPERTDIFAGFRSCAAPQSGHGV